MFICTPVCVSVYLTFDASEKCWEQQFKQVNMFYFDVFSYFFEKTIYFYWQKYTEQMIKKFSCLKL